LRERRGKKPRKVIDERKQKRDVDIAVEMSGNNRAVWKAN